MFSGRPSGCPCVHPPGRCPLTPISSDAIFLDLCLFHTADADKTICLVLSCPRLRCEMNSQQSRLSTTENFETEHV